MKYVGAGRNADWPKSLLFYFDSVPTDDEMRFLADVMARAVPLIPAKAGDALAAHSAKSKED